MSQLLNYKDEMQLQINDVTENLYAFKKNENDYGMSQCNQLVNLCMNLGCVNNQLRGILNKHTPIQYELLDQWLETIEINRLEPLFLIAIIRYTAIAKDGLKHWIILRNNIALQLEKLGINSKKVLVGLY